MHIQTIGELESELNQGRFWPVYVVLGPEAYLVRKALDLLKSRTVAANTLAFNFSEFSLQHSALSAILDAANTYPMMSPRRLVLATDIEKLTPGDQATLTGYLEHPAKTCSLVLTGGNLDRRTALYKSLRQKTLVAEFSKLKGAALERWTEDHLLRHGCRINSASIKKLVELAGSDLQSVVNETEKLLLCAGRGKPIDDSTIDALVIGSGQHGIFELTGAIGRRDRGRALMLLGNLLDGGQHPLVIVTMIARHFRQVLISKELLTQGRNSKEVAAAAGIPSFVLSEFLRQVRNIDSASARMMYLQVAAMDLRFKSSSADERMCLESLIASL